MNAGRFTLIIMTVLFLAFAIIELVVILNLSFSRALVRIALWAGALLWTAVLVVGLVDTIKTKERSTENFLAGVFIVSCAGVSITGVFVASLQKHSLWLNLLLSIFFLGVFLWNLPKAWKDEGMTYQVYRVEDENQ